MRNPVFSFDWNALGNGCALRKDTLESRVMPMRRKMYPGIGITVAIDQSTESGEGQIKAIDGMREEHRVSFRGFDGPQVVELDNEAVGFEKWGAGDLALIVESDRRTRKIECSARGDFVVPGDLAVLDPQVADERNQKPAGHCIDERRAALYRFLVAQIDCAEGLRRHRLDPVGNAQVCRYRGRQLSIEFRRAAEFECQRLMLAGHGSFFNVGWARLFL